MPSDSIVEILWRDDAGTHSKKIPWRRPKTNEALAEWIADYFDRLTDGYAPLGHDTPPLPHCCRVIHAGKVVAEWISKRRLSPTRPAESLVTAPPPLGSGGIPTVVPSAPCSERLLVPTQPVPRGVSADSDRRAAIRRTSPDSIRDVLTTG